MPFKNTAVYALTEKVVQLNNEKGAVFQRVLSSQKLIDLIEFLQTESQMGTAHVDSKGAPLFSNLTDRGTYSLFDKQGRGGQQYRLFDTGEFWESTKVEIGPNQILITMNPIKDGDNLFEIYGEDIEGLTEESKQILINESLRAFINFYRQELTNVRR